jgi:hypothetical protein
MGIPFYHLKNYLCAKSNLKYLIPVLAVFIFTSCSKQAGSQSYDLPPTAPIPPEKYCFEQKAAGSSDFNRLELNVEGDSAYGKVDYAKSMKAPSGNFKGVLYGTTLIIKYKFKSDTGLVTQEQEWNFVNDTLFRTTVNRVRDTLAENKVDSAHVHVLYALHKVPCR